MKATNTRFVASVRLHFRDRSQRDLDQGQEVIARRPVHATTRRRSPFPRQRAHAVDHRRAGRRTSSRFTPPRRSTMASSSAADQALRSSPEEARSPGERRPRPTFSGSVWARPAGARLRPPGRPRRRGIGSCPPMRAGRRPSRAQQLFGGSTCRRLLSHAARYHGANLVGWIDGRLDDPTTGSAGAAWRQAPYQPVWWLRRAPRRYPHGSTHRR